MFRIGNLKRSQWIIWLYKLLAPPPSQKDPITSSPSFLHQKSSCTVYSHLQRRSQEKHPTYCLLLSLSGLLPTRPSQRAVALGVVVSDKAFFHRLEVNGMSPKLSRMKEMIERHSP